MPKKRKTDKKKSYAHKQVTKKAAAPVTKPEIKKAQEGTNADKRAAKKAIVLGTRKRSRLPRVYLLAGSALLIAAALFFVSRIGQERSAVAVDVVASDTSTTVVTYPVGLFDDGQARFFSYAADDSLTIKYFILKSSDGVIRAAFNACDVCWRAGKGYYQSGDVMVCRNCGRTFASVLVNEVKGGCNPTPLNRSVVDGKIIIEAEDILEGKQYFDFSQKGLSNDT